MDLNFPLNPDNTGMLSEELDPTEDCDGVEEKARFRFLGTTAACA